MISVDNVSVRFGAFVLFDGISFQVNPGDRIGLVGRNGAGKTTLLNLVDGSQQPDEGKVVVTSDKSIGYLPQQMRHKKGKTLLKETMEAFSEVLDLKRRIKSITSELEERTDHHSEAYLALIQELANANERFELQGGNTLQADTEQTLTGLGFDPGDMDRPVHEFSGGWRMRVELAKILLRRPDFLLLDEPTNHLDIESIQWLENFLAGYPGGILIISHDRVFLDRVTNRTLELSLGKIYDYKVSYSRYVELKEERIAVQKASYANQQKMIQDTEQFINRFRYKATKAVQVQSRIKQLEKLDRIEVEQEETQAMNLRFPPARRSGTIVVEAGGLGKKFGTNTVLQGVDMVIERGEKVAFVGRNGEGKTTLSRIIVGELDHTGKLKTGHNVELGYFAQNQDEIMDGDLTVMETVDRVAVGEIRTRMRDILGAFLFSGEDVDKKVKVLSGGERSRLAMARMLLQPFNVLILDEPTNHLDMRSKDILKNALLAFDGTLIVVSHDREFLDGLVDKVYEFRSGGVREHLGGIYDFLKRKNITSLREIERKTPAASSGKGNSGKGSSGKGNSEKGIAGRAGSGRTGAGKESSGKPGPAGAEKRGTPEKREDSPAYPAGTPGSGKQAYEERKAQERKIRKLSNRVRSLEHEIEEIETEMGRLDQLLMDPEKARDMKLFEEYDQLKKRHDETLSNWEKQTLQLEKAEARRN